MYDDNESYVCSLPIVKLKEVLVRWRIHISTLPPLRLCEISGTRIGYLEMY
jgi:hypothetical protein